MNLEKLERLGLLSYYDQDNSKDSDVGYRVLFFTPDKTYDVVGYWADVNEAILYAKDLAKSGRGHDIRTPVVYYGPENLGKDWK